jgi:hypothetical protein
MRRAQPHEHQRLPVQRSHGISVKRVQLLYSHVESLPFGAKHRPKRPAAYGRAHDDRRGAFDV